MPFEPLSTTDGLEKQELELTEFESSSGGVQSNPNHVENELSEDPYYVTPEMEALMSNRTSPLSHDHGHQHDGGGANNVLQRARRLLYLSHFFAQFSEVSWQFCLTIFLAALTNYESLFLVATYGLTTGIAVTLLGSTTGSWVDRTNRLVAARGFILTQNVCVILATLCCFQLLSLPGLSSPENADSANNSSLTDIASVLLIVAIHLLGAAARVLDEGFLVAIERDWLVVMSRFVDGEDTTSNSKQQTTHSRTWLSESNVAMKQIDLSCKVVAPAVSGLWIAMMDHHNDHRSSSTLAPDSNVNEAPLESGGQLRYAALAVGGINILSLLVEYYCTSIIYERIPDLQVLRHKKQEDKGIDVSIHTPKSAGDTHEDTPSPIIEELSHWTATMLPSGARIYLRQKTALAGIGLAMLYLNALTFDAIFTAYLVWRGMGLETIGIWRGISSAVGLLGTCVYHWSVQHMTLEMTGMWSIVYQFLCLSLSYGSLYVKNDDHLSLVLLIAGVCMSRIGLWVFDIAVTQMMQESIPDGVRGIVGGVQQSLNAFFNLISYGLGIVLPSLSHFHIYVAAGYASVGVAMLLYGFEFCSRKRTDTKTQLQSSSSSSSNQ